MVSPDAYLADDCIDLGRGAVFPRGSGIEETTIVLLAEGLEARLLERRRPADQIAIEIHERDGIGRCTQNRPFAISCSRFDEEKPS